MDKKKTMGNFYSPYQVNEDETMEDWYARYLDDKEKLLFKERKCYSKIIHRCELYLKEGFNFLVMFEPQEEIRIGDYLTDEKGNLFIVEGFEQLRFANGVPEWYPKVVPTLIRGSSYEIGTYLCKRMDDASKEVLKNIVTSILENADELSNLSRDEFFEGKRLAYYEVLDMIKSRLCVNDYNLEEFGLKRALEEIL